jgi:hypothetical protein
MEVQHRVLVEGTVEQIGDGLDSEGTSREKEQSRCGVGVGGQKRGGSRVGNAVEKKGKESEEAGRRSPGADVKELALVADGAANPDEGAQGSEGKGCGKKVGGARRNPIASAEEIVPQLVTEQDEE